MGAMLLDLVKRAKPGAFIDARLSVESEDAIVYRTRQPIISDVNKVPMFQDFGIFKVSAMMCGRTQVGICVRFKPDIIAAVTQGDHARFVSPKVVRDVGEARTAMRTSDFLIFDYSSRGALLLKKLQRGRGY